MRKIKCINQNLVYSNPKNKWVKLYFDEVQFPDGTKGNYNRVVESDGKLGVVILPIWENKIGMVKQYRYPVNKEMWELPRGFGESMNPKQDSIRELQEETGIKLPIEKIIDMGFIYPNSGILSNKTMLYAGICHSKNNKASDLHEISDIQWINKSIVLEKISKGQIVDGFTLTAIFKALLKKIL